MTPTIALTLMFAMLLAASVAVLLVWNTVLVMRGSVRPPRSDKLDDEITQLEVRIMELSGQPEPLAWQTSLVLWKARKRLEELKNRRVRYQEAARKWAERAKGVCTPESLPQRPRGFRLPSFRDRIWRR